MTARAKLRTGATVLAVALLAAACGGGSSGSGSGSAPGVTADTILIGSHQPLTGTASTGYGEIAPAAKAFFDFTNSNGGVNGRKVVYRYLDDQYNPTQTVSVTKQLVLQDKVFAIMSGLGTPTHTKVLDFLTAQRVPDLFPASGCACWDDPKKHPNVFAYAPNYVVEGKLLGNYVKNAFGGRKVAYFYQDDEFGRGGVEGLDKYIPGDQVVARESYLPTNTDVGPQVAKIAAAKPDVVVLFTIPAFSALFRLQALKLGISPTYVVTAAGADPTSVGNLLEDFAKRAGVTVNGEDLIQGTITEVYLPVAVDLENSWVKLFKKVHDQYIPDRPFNGYAVYGMAQAYLFLQAVKKAGPNLTRQGIIDALESGTLSPGPSLVPLNYSKDSHTGYSGGQVGIIRDGRWVTQGPPQTTDRADGPIEPVTQPQLQAPDNGLPTG